jgi:hypothetical protein
VQSAIARARREFGDEVTLVTSHIASADARHLGEYEVVFAVDEEEPAPEPAVEPVVNVQVEAEPDSEDEPELAVMEAPEEEPAAPRFSQFQEALLGAVAIAKKPVFRNVLDQIDSVRSTLIELGIEPVMVRALMTLIERSIDAAILPEMEDGTGVMLSHLADSLTPAATEVAAHLPSVSAPVAPMTIEALVDEAFESMLPDKVEPAPQPPIAAAEAPRTGMKLRLELPAREEWPAKTVTHQRPQPRLSAAELAFMMSVSEGADAVRR